MGNLSELLNLAQSQVGYQEKQSDSMLDEFHANAVYRNYTKYARDVDNWGLMGCHGALPINSGWKQRFLG